MSEEKPKPSQEEPRRDPKVTQTDNSPLHRVRPEQLQEAIKGQTGRGQSKDDLQK